MSVSCIYKNLSLSLCRDSSITNPLTTHIMKKEPHNTLPLPLELLTLDGHQPGQYYPILSRNALAFCTLHWSREVCRSAIKEIEIGIYYQSLYGVPRIEHYEILRPALIFQRQDKKRILIASPALEYDTYIKHIHWHVDYVKVTMRNGKEYRIKYKIYRYGIED